MTTYAFAYGSLLDPDSVRSTLPSADVEALMPVKVKGYIRLWNVAFPNDGSQGDKAYYDEKQRRPPVVLFANIAARLKSQQERSVNGILLPVEEAALSRLRRRELRYELLDVTERIEPYDLVRDLLTIGSYAAVAFVGRNAFTRQEDVKRGVIPKSYMDTVLRGVTFWNRRVPGFEADFHASTRLLPTTEIVPLQRVDF